MELVDIAYIGTGPISVIDAALTQQKGKSVVLIDDKNQLGGAWVDIEVGNYGRLEIGCHIWSYNAKAYRFLEHFFELDLVKLAPQPYLIKDKNKITYDYKNGVITLKRLLGLVKRFKFRVAVQYFRHDPAARFPLIPKKYEYPKGGAREIQKAITGKIDQLGIITRLNTTIVSIHKDGDHWELVTNNGERIRTKKIVMTTTSAIKKITLGKRVLHLNHNKLDYTHFHLVLSKRIISPLSYVRVLDHKIIHRISDITYQVEGDLLNDQSVILVGVFNDSEHLPREEKDQVAQILAYLKTKNWVDETTEIVYAQKNTFETRYISKENLSELKHLDASLELMQTTDLIYGVYRRMKKWNV